MRMFTGYYKNDEEDLVDTQNDITINSCGRYELIHQKVFKTSRPLGRSDFQLIYVSSGEAYITLNGKEEIVRKGNMVIYFPGEEQCYYYFNTPSTIIYWIHFSGHNVHNILKGSHFNRAQVYHVGSNMELITIFDKIIAELNSTRAHNIDLCRLYFKEWLALSSRSAYEILSPQNKKNTLIEEAIKYFHENSSHTISIEQYAHDHNISCCWFIRNFKSLTGTTPTHYITMIRINKAKSLLVSGSFTIGQIADIVGYDNSLYFSRIFKKYVGVSPKNYYALIEE